MLTVTGSAEMPYWEEFFKLEDERRLAELKFAAGAAI